MQRKCKTSGVHVWLVLGKAFQSLAAHARASLSLSRAGLGDSEFRVLEVLLHKGPLPVNMIGPKVWLTTMAGTARLPVARTTAASELKSHISTAPAKSQLE